MLKKGESWSQEEHRGFDHGSKRIALNTRGVQHPTGPKAQTVQHMTKGFKMLAHKAYLERHNQVAGIGYRNRCTETGLEVPG